MKKLIFPILGLLLVFGCQREAPPSKPPEPSEPPPPWMSGTSEPTGMTIINPYQSLDGEREWTLDEEFVIPGKREGEYTLGGLIRDLEIDGEGRILVLDRLNGCVRVFDGGGRYLRSIGRSGRDPGDMTEAEAFALDSAGRIHIVHVPKHAIRGRALTVLTPEGEVLKTMPLEEHIGPFGFTSDGQIVARVLDANHNQDIALFDENLKRLKTIASYPAPKPTAPESRETLVSFPKHPGLLLGFLNAHGFVYSGPAEHHLNTLNSRGDPNYRLEKDSLKLDLDTHLTFLGGDAAGNIYAVRIPSDESFFKDRKMFVDIYDEGGGYVHRITADAFAILKITKDAVFGMRSRDPHPPDIVKFKHNLSTVS
jgi:hypothetical protein